MYILWKRSGLAEQLVYKSRTLHRPKGRRAGAVSYGIFASFVRHRRHTLCCDACCFRVLYVVQGLHRGSKSFFWSRYDYTGGAKGLRVYRTAHRHEADFRCVFRVIPPSVLLSLHALPSTASTGVLQHADLAATKSRSAAVHRMLSYEIKKQHGGVSNARLTSAGFGATQGGFAPWETKTVCNLWGWQSESRVPNSGQVCVVGSPCTSEVTCETVGTLLACTLLCRKRVRTRDWRQLLRIAREIGRSDNLRLHKLLHTYGARVEKTQHRRAAA